MSVSSGSLKTSLFQGLWLSQGGSFTNQGEIIDDNIDCITVSPEVIQLVAPSYPLSSEERENLSKVRNGVSYLTSHCAQPSVVSTCLYSAFPC